VVTALVAAGLRVQSLRELDGDVMQHWPMMVRGEDRLYRVPSGTPSLPLMYVLRANREGWTPLGLMTGNWSKCAFPTTDANAIVATKTADLAR
jgi:hypothetical protein